MFTLSFIQNNITPPAELPAELPEYIKASGPAFDQLGFSEEAIAAAKGEYVKTTFSFDEELTGYISTTVTNDDLPIPCFIKFNSYTLATSEIVEKPYWEWRISAGAPGDTKHLYKLSEDLFDESTPWRISESTYLNPEEDDEAVITVEKVKK